VGKDFLAPGFIARTPGGTGAQLNFFGLAGVLVSWDEGIEFNFAGLSFGVNPLRATLELPIIGNVGFAREVKPRSL
jgi:hypothetical protein